MFEGRGYGLCLLMEQQGSGRVCGLGNTIAALRDTEGHVGHAVEPGRVGGNVHSLSGRLFPVFLNSVFLLF